MHMNFGRLWEMVRDREAWRAAVNGALKSWAWLGDWTTKTLSILGWLFLRSMNKNKLHTFTSHDYLTKVNKISTHTHTHTHTHIQIYHLDYSRNYVVNSHKRRFLLGRKAMTNLNSILKSRDVIFPTKIYIVKAMIFPVVMYRCESWTIRKAEHWRNDSFKIWSGKDSWDSLGLYGDQVSQS